MIFNIAASDYSLSEENCRNNAIHVAPTRSMLADAGGAAPSASAPVSCNDASIKALLDLVRLTPAPCRPSSASEYEASAAVTSLQVICHQCHTVPGISADRRISGSNRHWDPSTESWGEMQMQGRFFRAFRRTMTPLTCRRGPQCA